MYSNEIPLRANSRRVHDGDFSKIVILNMGISTIQDIPLPRTVPWHALPSFRQIVREMASFHLPGQGREILHL